VEATFSHNEDPLLCRCLAVTQSQVVDCIAVTGAETVRQVTECTGAGRGCLSCHRKIRDLIQERTATTAQVPVADGLR
jgi:NifU-like protein